MKRSDQSMAIYGLIVVAGIALIGGIVLLAMEREGAAELIAFAGIVGAGVLGWSRGGTYYDARTEVVPEADPPTPEVTP
jgi:hypothetical protein